MTHNQNGATKMETMQKRVLGKIEEILTAAKFDAVQQSDYANTGTIFGMRGLSVYIAVKYQFDNVGCSLKMSGHNVEEMVAMKVLQDSPPRYRVQAMANNVEVGFLALRYMDAERMDLMLDVLTDLADWENVG
jgi:hypothetical protein